MEIVWYGLSSFRITERGRSSVVTDPYPDDNGYVHPRPKGDVVTVSCSDPMRNYVRAVRSSSRVLDGPGEYEIGGVFITGVAVFRPVRGDRVSPRNTIFVFEIDDVTVCHLGALDHVPGQSQMEALGAVNVLLTPVGGNDLITADQATEVISMLEPNIIIPMHYQVSGTKLRLPRVETFMKEMGVEQVHPVDSLKVTKSSLPGETQVVLLNPTLNRG
jgi:L-ascorbate metabolism protein UlaG (beta-lactamase superfamily)